MIPLSSGSKRAITQMAVSLVVVLLAQRHQVFERILPISFFLVIPTRPGYLTALSRVRRARVR